jgi:hypothetical protein
MSKLEIALTLVPMAAVAITIGSIITRGVKGHTVDLIFLMWIGVIIFLVIGASLV